MIPSGRVFRTRSAGRRTGAVMLTEANGQLADCLPIATWLDSLSNTAMAPRPADPGGDDTGTITVPVGARVAEALEILRRFKISELPVIDADGRPVGLLDITDVIGFDGAADRRPLAA